MKKYVVIVLFVLAGAMMGGCGKGNALNVNEVASDPARHAGKITVTGVMAGVSREDPAVFGMFDTRELKCTTPNCNKLFLPVRCQKKLPVPGDEVRVTGSFVNSGRGYIFSADKVKIVKNHKIGG